MLKPSSSFYDTITPFYDSYCEKSGAEQTLEKEITLVESFSPKSLLECGCGTGRFAKAYLTRNPNTKYLGVDSSLSMLLEAKKHLPEQRFVYIDILSYFKESVACGAFFDVVVAPYTVFHHIPQKEQLEIFDLAKKLTNTLIINTLTADQEHSLFNKKESTTLTFYLPKKGPVSTTIFPISSLIRKTFEIVPLDGKRVDLLYTQKSLFF
jgi:SAM-dependent methyltransferase